MEFLGPQAYTSTLCFIINFYLFGGQWILLCHPSWPRNSGFYGPPTSVSCCQEVTGV